MGYSTFQVLGGQQDRSEMVVLDEGSDLWINGGSIEAHDKELAHLPVTNVTHGGTVSQLGPLSFSKEAIGCRNMVSGNMSGTR
jgi:hypothetical protein